MQVGTLALFQRFGYDDSVTDSQVYREELALAFELVKRSSPPLVRSNESCILVQWRDAKPCRLEIICLHNSQVSPL